MTNSEFNPGFLGMVILLAPDQSFIGFGFCLRMIFSESRYALFGIML
jgi:hypothetical protein